MTPMKQKEAVYSAVTSVFADAGITFEDGMNAGTMLTKELRGRVHSIMTEGFAGGTIVLEGTAANQAKLADESKLSGYVSGLISNWVRKDKRLNGAVAYVPANPGSRTGSTDPQLKTLRALYRQFASVDPVKAATVQSHIEARLSALRAEKAASAPVDFSALPAEVIASLGLES